MNQVDHTQWLWALDVRSRNHMNDPVKAFRLKNAAMVEITHPDAPPTHGFMLHRHYALRLGLRLLWIWLTWIKA